MKRTSLFKRRVLVWTGWLLVLLAGLYGLLAWHTLRAYERAVGDFELRVGPADHARYVREAVTAQRNTAVAFPAAMAGVTLDASWSRAREPAAWTDAEARSVREGLDGEGAAVAALEAALELPHCVWPSVPDDSLAWSRPALNGSRLLRLLGFVGVRDGDRALVERAFRGLGSLADCLYDQPHLVGSLVATAVSRARLEVVRAAVASPATGPEVLEIFSDGLRRSLDLNRVDWAVAAEGAFALEFIEDPGMTGAASRAGSVHSVFSRRAATEFAGRWIELRAWSERPLEDLLTESLPPAGERVPAAGVIAEILIPNLRDAVIKLRILEKQTRLGLAAVEARRHGLETGAYEGAFPDHPELEIMGEGDGGIVVLDSGLGRLLRERPDGSGSDPTPGTEATLELTVWRLPPPRGD